MTTLSSRLWSHKAFIGVDAYKSQDIYDLLVKKHYNNCSPVTFVIGFLYL